MPVKRRSSKRRIDPGTELFAWESVFETRYDFFGDLADIGIKTDAYGVPEVYIAKSAWQRLGRLFLDGYAGTNAPWALEQFGEPEQCQ